MNGEPHSSKHGQDSSDTPSPLASIASQNAAKSGGVPGFIAKLYRMIDADPAATPFIHWTAAGKSFLVVSPEEFSREILPKYYKHNNFSSFVRQLNMYGFRKVGASVAGGAAGNWEFEHQCFQRDAPDTLADMKRKVGKEEQSSSVAESADAQTQLSTIKQQQAAIRADISTIKRDSQLLWNETMASRERHQTQQQVIDKILRFLASVFSGDKLPGVPTGANSSSIDSSLLPKKQRLMIEDSMDPDLRKQVFELMNRHPSPPATDTRSRVYDLSENVDCLNGDIELFEDRLDSLVGFEDPVLPDPPVRPQSSDPEFDITRYIQESPIP